MSELTSSAPEQTSSAERSAASSVSAAPPGAVIDLLGLLAYGDLVGFQRMAADAALAPDLNRRALLSEMAGTEIAHFRRVADRLAELGAEVVTAMTPFQSALDDFHEQTEPSSWLEALTKAYVGNSIADDFVREVAEAWPPADRHLFDDMRHDSRYAPFAADEIRSALAADPTSGDRLSMWARRVVGEAISQAQQVAAQRPSIVATLVGGGTELASLGTVLTRLTTAHTRRMSAVGLNN